MGISNLTSSIRGVTGTERILNLNKLETQVLVANEATIGGISIGTNLVVRTGVLNVGVNDTTVGVVNIYSGAGKDTTLRLFVDPGEDGTVDFYGIRVPAESADLFIGPDTNLDALKYDGADDWWLFNAEARFDQGTVRIGKAAVAGDLALRGAATGSVQGGKIALHTADDHDSAIVSFNIDVNEDDLRIGPNTDLDSFKYDGGTGKWEFTATGGVTFAGPLDLLFTPANAVTVNTIKLDINPTGILTGGFTDHVGLYIDLDSDVNADGEAYYTEGISVDIDYAGIDEINGMDGALLTVTNGGIGTINNAYGAEIWIDQDGAGTITTGYGTYTWINRGSGTFTTAYGHYVEIDGVIGTAYGFHANLTDHTGNSWGIYCDGEDNNYLSGNLAVEGGTITVGSVDTVTGAIVLFGNGDQTGGRITLHSGANLDATINSYSMLVGQDDFRIGPAANASALMYRGIDNWWVFNAPTAIASGTLDVGLLWEAGGVINLHGAGGQSNQGGKIRLYNATTFKPNSALWFDINVVGSNLEIGPSIQTDSFIYDGVNRSWEFREGAVEIGVADTTTGIVKLHGNNDDAGGEIHFYPGLGFGAADYFKMYIEEASFHLKAVGTPDRSILEYEAQNRSLNFYPNNTIDFQNATALVFGRGDIYLNMNSSIGAVGYGLRDLNGSVQFRHSGGTWTDFS